MLLSMRLGPGTLPNILGYRSTPAVIVELLSVAEAMLFPDGLRQLLRVSPNQCLRAGKIDFPQPRTRPACQIQPLLHLGGVTAIGGLELLDRGDFASEGPRDVHGTKLRAVMSAFSRPIGSIRRVVVCLGDRNRRQAHLSELRPDESSGTVGEFLRRTRGPEVVPVGLVVNPRIGVEYNARLVYSNQREKLVPDLVARHL